MIMRCEDLWSNECNDPIPELGTTYNPTERPTKEHLSLMIKCSLRASRKNIIKPVYWKEITSLNEHLKFMRKHSLHIFVHARRNMDKKACLYTPHCTKPLIFTSTHFYFYFLYTILCTFFLYTFL